MATRSDILAGRAVVVVDIQDATDKGLRVLRSKLRVFSNSISEIGGDLFRGGLAGTAASIFPVKEFTNFQDQLLFLQTKLQVTDQAMKPLESRIRQLGMSTSFSSQEVAKAATAYAQAGFSLQETSAALQAALDLARGGQVDLATATTILSNSLRTFSADASEADAYASKFIAAARLGTLDLVDLGQSLTYASGTFATLGVGIDEVLGLITNLSTAGLKASLAGTSLQTAFSNLSGSAEKLKETLDVTLTEEDFKTPVNGIRKLEEALLKLPLLDRIKAVQSLVNIRGGRAVFGQILSGTDRLADITKQIAESTDEARSSAAKLDSRLGGVFRRAISAFQEFNLAIGKTSEGPLTSFGEGVAAFFNDMSQLSSKNSRFVQGLLLIGPVSLVAGAGLLFMTTVMSKMVMLIGPLISLNAVLFKTAAAIVGANVKAGAGLVTLIRTLPQALNSSILSTSFDASTGILGFFRSLGNVDLSRPIKQAEELVKFTEIIQRRSARSFASGANFAQLLPDNAKLTPANFKLPIVTAPVKTKFIQQLFDFDAIDANAISKTKIATQFRPLSQIIAEAAKTAISMSQNQGFDLSDAINQVIKANDLPFTLVPALEKSIAASLQEGISKGVVAARKRPLKNGLPILSGPFQDNLPQKLFNFDAIPARKFIPSGPFDSGFQAPKTLQALGGKGAFAAKQIAIEQAQAAKVIKQSPVKAAVIGLGKTFKTLDFGGALTRFITPFTSGIQKSVPLVKGLGTALGAVGKAIFTTNWLGVFITFSKSVGIALKGVFTLANTVRRFVFSFSGFLTIVELLFIFGDKIPGISNLLEKLGSAFSRLFGNIGTTLSNTLPSLQKMGDALKNIFTGNAEGGLAELQIGFGELTNTLSTGLSNAWQQFKADLEPITSVVKQIGLSLAAGFQLAIDLISATFGNISSGFKIIIGSEGSFLETLQQAFSAENIQGFFATIGGAFVAMFKVLNVVLSSIMEVINLSKNGIIQLLKVVSLLPGGGGANAVLDEADPRRKAARDKIIGLQNNRDLDQEFVRTNPGNAAGVAEARARLLAAPALIKEAQAEFDNLGPIIGTFAFNLEESSIKIDEALTRFIDSLGTAVPIIEALPVIGTTPETNTLDAYVAALPKTDQSDKRGILEGRLRAWEEELNNTTVDQPGYREDVQGIIDDIKGDLSALNGDTSEFEVGKSIDQQMKDQIQEDFNPMDWFKADLDKAFANVMKPPEAEIKQAEALAGIVSRALVGNFNSTTGNKLQGMPRAEKLAERTALATEEIAKNSDPAKQTVAAFQ